MNSWRQHRSRSAWKTFLAPPPLGAPLPIPSSPPLHRYGHQRGHTNPRTALRVDSNKPDHADTFLLLQVFRSRDAHCTDLFIRNAPAKERVIHPLGECGRDSNRVYWSKESILFLFFIFPFLFLHSSYSHWLYIIICPWARGKFHKAVILWSGKFHSVVSVLRVTRKR